MVFMQDALKLKRLVQLQTTANIDMKLYSSPAEYLISRGIMNAGQADIIYRRFREQNKLHRKNTIDFELTAYEYGFLNEDSLIDCIVSFRGLDVVRKDELDIMTPIFDVFPAKFCKKHHCFQYKSTTTKPDVVCMVASLNNPEIEPTIKRNVEKYRIRYTIPAYVEEKLTNI